jgi:hypothetical protein
MAGATHGAISQHHGLRPCGLLSVLGAVSLGLFMEAFHFESSVFIAAIWP